ncbi:MAG: AraC family transcriptional regulator [Treponema sp.]|jgi:AraC-like DNA-binding protein|nr:AraC family transcriptional regulator [Treponema sp.]
MTGKQPPEAWESFLHYLPCSEEDEKLGMVCTTAGSIETAPRTVYPPRKNEHPALFRSVAEGRALPEFQIVYITKGEGSFTAEGGTYNVQPGSLFLIPPGMKHRYSPLFETGWHERWVGFRGTYFDSLADEHILSRERIFFDMGLSDHLVAIFDGIFEEARTQRPLYQFKACAGIVSLIAEITARERRKQPNHYQKIVEKAKYLMESNIYSTVNLSGLSEQLGISGSRLFEIFKTYTSMTPYQYYIHIKIHKAETLLEQNDISVKEAAHRMGFEDQYYFSRVFKRTTGFTPSQWRKLFR